MTRRLLIIPTELEAEPLIERLKVKLEKAFPFPTACLGKGKDFISISGAGKVNAALCALFLAERFKVDEVWIAGIAGAYPGSGLNIGDVIFAEREIYGDERFEPKNFVLFVPEGEGGKTFLTLSVLPESTEEAKRLAARFGAHCENMEGAAVAHACSILNVKCVELRAISNWAGDRNKKNWKVDKALKNLTEKLLRYFG